MSHFFYVGGGIRGHCHTFYFMLKMAYNSSRNAKKILGRGGANPLNCHTKWGGDQKRKCDKCHTFFFFFYFDGLPQLERRLHHPRLLVDLRGELAHEASDQNRPLPRGPADVLHSRLEQLVGPHPAASCEGETGLALRCPLGSLAHKEVGL